MEMSSRMLIQAINNYRQQKQIFSNHKKKHHEHYLTQKTFHKLTPNSLDLLFKSTIQKISINYLEKKIQFKTKHIKAPKKNNNNFRKKKPNPNQNLRIATSNGIPHLFNFAIILSSHQLRRRSFLQP